MQEKKKKRPSRRLRSILLILLGIAGCIAVSAVIFLIIVVQGLIGYGEAFGNKCLPDDNPIGIEGFASFKLPPSARLLNTNCGGMQGWWAYAEFEMNPKDMDILLSSTHVKAPLGNSLDTALYYGIKRDKEQEIAKMQSLLYGKYEPSADYLQEILIDTSNPKLYIVYIQVLGG